VPTQIEIVWRPSQGEASIVLRSAADANAATTAFHQELARLRRQKATGELIMRWQEATGELFRRNGDRPRPPLFRQPLQDHNASVSWSPRPRLSHQE
jgi:hypothetical protein